LNKTYYNTEVTTLDFSKDSAADTINGWIEDATKGKIERMLEPPIQPDVVLYLINAIYFKGKWTTPFDKDDTRDGTFTNSHGQQQTVPMMYRKDTIEYFEGDSYKAVRLPYGEGRLSMVCILPSEETDISALLEGMDETKWEEVRAGLAETEDVIVQIPRFKLEYGVKELNDSLISLGMEEAFSPYADFSGIREGIFINRVLHKAVIEVNEQGSEAAGATVVEMNESAAMEPVTFITDRPFLFLIVDDTTGTILFLGTLQEIAI
jgi:serpin B